MNGWLGRVGRWGMGGHRDVGSAKTHAHRSIAPAWYGNNVQYKDSTQKVGSAGLESCIRVHMHQSLRI